MSFVSAKGGSRTSFFGIRLPSDSFVFSFFGRWTRAFPVPDVLSSTATLRTDAELLSALKSETRNNTLDLIKSTPVFY